MSKKRKSRSKLHNPRASAQTSTKTSIDGLVKEAESHLQAGRYRDAIASYKQLLKHEKRPQWLEALANAYLERARQLADKGMYKEAAALWENMADLCGARQHLQQYLDWLLRAGQVIRAAKMFVDAEDAFRQSPDGQRLGTLLAGLLVSGHKEIAAALPAETPLVSHYQTVVDALRAFCQGDDAALKEHLKRIPYRSPYRDLRWILQALPEVVTAPDTANELLAKIPPDSPFARLAGWVRTAGMDGEPLLQAIGDIAPAARDVVLTLKGWNTTQIKLADELLARGEKQASNQSLFKLVIANQGLFGVTEAQRFCLALLSDYPQGKGEYEKHFGALAPLEWERLSALAAERHDDLGKALRHWKQCVRHLEQNPTQGDEALKAALVLRHVADLSVRLNGPDPWNNELQRYLTDSLKLDPDDKDTYLKLMVLAQQRDDTKAHDRWVEQAVRQFSGDPDILMAASAAAYRRGAFKKAAGFAHDLLKRDPINRNARNMLLSCHLGHTRKHIKAGKYTLAAKELAIATQFAQNDEQHGALGLTRGFLALLEGSDTGAAILEQAYQQLGAGLIAHFRFLVEGQRLQINQRTLSQYLNQIKPKQQAPATAKDILQLADLINRYVSDGVDGISNILNQLRKPLKAAAKLDYAEKEMSGICAALERAEHHGLLRDYGEAALTRWGQRPIFVYYSIFGRTKGWPDKMTTLEDLQLQTALDNAIANDDHEAIGLIEDFIGFPPLGGPMPFLPPGAPPNAGMDELFNELADELEADYSPEEIMEALEEILRKTGLPGPKPPKRRR